MARVQPVLTETETALVEQMAPPRRLIVVAQANHFFAGEHIGPLAEGVTDFASRGGWTALP